jgi:putative copper resistance protein D
MFLFVRADPEVWAMGEVGFFESFRDVEVPQHRFFVLLIVAFVSSSGGCAPRTGTTAPPRWSFLCAVGGTMLLTHSHAIANIKD